MQAAAAPWRAVLRTTHLLVDPTRLAASSFHSTPVSSAKWKDKFDCKHEHGARKLSKNYERYVVRQKRAEGKKALKDYLLFGKSSPHLQVRISVLSCHFQIFVLPLTSTNNLFTLQKAFDGNTLFLLG
jgi:hypothetical protein